MADESWRATFAPFKGRSDEEVREQAGAMGGLEVLLGVVLDGMASRVLPEKAAEDAVVSYRLDDRDRELGYSLVLGGGRAKVEPGARDDADVTYHLSAPDFLRLLAGEIDGPGAFQAGRITIAGDPGRVVQLQGLLG